MQRKMKIGVVIGIIAFGIFISRPVIEYLNRPFGQRPENQLSSLRNMFMPSGPLTNLISSRPGDSILDLGAGVGKFTFPLSDSVGPSGTIFATDIDADAIAFIGEKARNLHVSNIVPVVVRDSGFDPFYRKHTFDVILAADVVTLIDSPKSFFDAMRSSLKEETGRLWIIDLKLDPNFSAIEIVHPDKLPALIRSERFQHTIASRFRAGTLRDIAAIAEAGDQSHAVSSLIEDLNTLLEAPDLWRTAMANSWPFDKKNERLCQSLNAIENPSNDGAVPKRIQRLRNRLVLMDFMQIDTWMGAVQLNEIPEPQLSPILKGLQLPEFPDYFNEVGYEVVKKHTAFDYCNIWELKRAR